MGAALRWLWASLLLVVAVATRAQVPVTEPDFTGLVLKDVQQTISTCLSEVQHGRTHLALGRIDSALFPNGVTLALDPTVADPLTHRAFTRAMRAWNEALGLDCPLQLAKTGTEPEVWVRLTSMLPTGMGHELGLIQLERRVQYSRTLHRVIIKGTISVLQAHRGHAMTEDEQFHIMLHEMGHLLGLDDVPNVGPLMGPMQRGRTLTAVPAEEAVLVRQLRAILRQRSQQVTLLASTMP